MKLLLFACLILLLLTDCRNTPRTEIALAANRNTVIANQFIDAFYSFDKDLLEAILSDAKSSQPNIVYYQGWAACGNYAIVKRGEAILKNDSLVVCPVTVKDDLMRALQIDFNVTDTFHIKIVNEKIRSVETSSNDLPTYYEAKEWVKKNRPELVEKQCEGVWQGGPTPCECIKGMIKGFADFVVSGNAQ